MTTSSPTDRDPYAEGVEAHDVGLLGAVRAMCLYVGLAEDAPTPDITHLRFLARDLYDQIPGPLTQEQVDAEVERILTMSDQEVLAATAPVDRGLARLLRSQVEPIRRAVDAEAVVRAVLSELSEDTAECRQLRAAIDNALHEALEATPQSTSLHAILDQAHGDIHDLAHLLGQQEATIERLRLRSPATDDAMEARNAE